MSKCRTWTDDQLIQAFSYGKSIADILRRLGLGVKANNYATIKKHMRRLNLDQNQLLGQRSTPAQKIPFEEIFKKGSNYHNGTRMKKLLIERKLLTYKCAKCDTADWCGKPLVLHLDHINGTNNDNRVENLRLLCPNCHSQTSTYCFSNRKYIIEERPCEYCKHNFKARRKSQRFCSVTCRSQSQSKKLSVPRPHKRKVKNRPSKQELLKLLESNNYCAVGRMFGVSDNAIRKWLK